MAAVRNTKRRQSRPGGDCTMKLDQHTPSCRRVATALPTLSPSPLNAERAGVRGERVRQPAFDERGITLIECLVYISLVFVILGMATVAFYRCFDNMKSLRRNSNDITQALNVGELWREDVRAATKPVRFAAEDQL